MEPVKRNLPWVSNVTYVDGDTGEIIQKKEYKKHYKTINKNEKAYNENHFNVAEKTYIGSKQAEQLELF